MYRVFIKEKTVFFDSNKNIKRNDQNTVYVEHNKTEDILGALNNFVNNQDNYNNIVFLVDNPKLSWLSFIADFKHIPAAGGLILNENGELLMIFRKGVWDLPKGKIENTEKIENAAIREVTEETGIKNPVLEKYIHTTWHLYQIKNKWVIKPTHWYLMQCSNNVEVHPQEQENITEVKWFNKIEILEILNSTYPLIRELIKDYYI